MTKLNLKIKILDTIVHKLTCGFKVPNYKTHKGADIVPNSTSETPNVLAYDNGVVIALGNVQGTNSSTGTAGMGTFVAIRHDNGLITRYQHLKFGQTKVRKGDRVRQGQPIGVYGRPTTGNSTGCHLHLDISAPVNLGGKVLTGTFCNEKRFYVDPIPYLELQSGTVTAPVNIRTGAGTNYSVVGELNAGEGVTIYGTSGSWVRISPNLSRWIHKNYVKM